MNPITTHIIISDKTIFGGVDIFISVNPLNMNAKAANGNRISINFNILVTTRFVSGVTPNSSATAIASSFLLYNFMIHLLNMIPITNRIVPIIKLYRTFSTCPTIKPNQILLIERKNIIPYPNMLSVSSVNFSHSFIIYFL